MAKDDVHGAAEARLRRAQERMARALERQRQSEREAEAATDPALGQVHLDEAAMHRRAAELHERAVRAQALHAEHTSPTDGPRG